ncbi:hypothetical protein [Citrobacter sp. CRE-46]|uniref:hypothetical protein n=1 Tax=Citrobacter TaxID=544 RepID=UPI000D7CD07B|nr:hypothetical protein [Citrobacter sp. CRE-46]AWS93892.1 hypothetical protein AN232_00765 [Citrobacter sp. CRE-46]
MKKDVNGSEILRKIRESKGSIYLDLAHQRSFSLNVFQMNALELIEAVQKVKDPDQGLLLMMENNREAGLQAHRELNRHVHNFVSSSLTLVEHTRVFMRKNYSDTQLLQTYETQVVATFAKSPVAQFVQGLRNYMLHRGLPASSMFMKFVSNPGEIDGSGSMETGVHYDTASLLDWRDWKAPARTYLENAGEHLDIHDFAIEYLTLVNQFHEWLDNTLNIHHLSDLQELKLLQSQFQMINQNNAEGTPEKIFDSQDSEPFSFHSAHVTELDRISLEIMGKVRPIHFKPRISDFPTDRPIITITDKELIGPVTFWQQDLNGKQALTFFTYDGKPHGFTEDDYEHLDALIDSVMKAVWAPMSLSRKFVETVFFNWVRREFPVAQNPFSLTLCEIARDKVKNVEIWAPVANLEVEQGFDFGTIRIEPITPSAIDNICNRASKAPAGQELEVSQYFEKLRNDFQGYAAVVVSINAEPEFASERAFQIARDAVGLLTFFSPSAPTSYLFNPVALSGAEYIPSSKLITLFEGGYGHYEGILPKKIAYWRLSAQQIKALNTDIFETAGSLIIDVELSEFAAAVRGSILTYTKGTNLLASKERLRSCLSALEMLLLRHDMEPRAHCIAKRMGVIISMNGIDDANEVKRIAQQIHWLLEQPQQTELSHRENELISLFTNYTYNVLYLALGNARTFHSKKQFINEIDRIGNITE